MTERFTFQSTGEFNTLIDERWEERGYLLHGLTEEQAQYACMIGNAGGFTSDDRMDLIDEIEDAVTYTNCTVCERTVMQGQLDDAKRCDGCQS